METVNPAEPFEDAREDVLNGDASNSPTMSSMADLPFTAAEIDELLNFGKDESCYNSAETDPTEQMSSRDMNAEEIEELLKEDEHSNSAETGQNEQTPADLSCRDESLEANSPAEQNEEAPTDTLNEDALCSTTMSLLAATYGLNPEANDEALDDGDDIAVIGEETLQSRSLAKLSTLDKVLNQVVSSAPLNRSMKVVLPKFVRGKLTQNDHRKVQQENFNKAAEAYREGNKEKSKSPEVVVEEELSEEEGSPNEEEAGSGSEDFEPPSKAFKSAEKEGYVKAGYRLRGGVQRPPNYDHDTLMEWKRIAEEKKYEEERKRKEQFSKKKTQEKAKRGNRQRGFENERDVGLFFDMLSSYIRQNEEREAAEAEDDDNDEDDVEVLDVVSEHSEISSTLQRMLDSQKRKVSRAQLSFSTAPRTRTSVPSFIPRRVVHIAKRPVNLFDQPQLPKPDDSFSTMPQPLTRVLMPKSKIIRPKLSIAPPRPLHSIPPTFSTRATIPRPSTSKPSTTAAATKTPSLVRQTSSSKAASATQAQPMPTLTATPFTSTTTNEVYQTVTIPASMFPKNGEPLQLILKMSNGSNVPPVIVQTSTNAAATSPQSTSTANKVLDEITIVD